MAGLLQKDWIVRPGVGTGWAEELGKNLLLGTMKVLEKRLSELEEKS